MDFQQGGELYFHLRKAYRFDEKIAKFVAAELVLALDHLHQKNILYRDLKPENIMLGSDGHVKIADFGLSKTGINPGELTHSIVGTPEYLAPEVYMEHGHTHMCDWWSLGALIYEMLTGSPPFYSSDKAIMFRNRMTKELEMKPWFSDATQSILRGLLQNDPRDRLGADGVQEIKNAKFFKDINWSLLEKKQIPSPFEFSFSDDTDLRYFDKMFTEEPARDSPLYGNEPTEPYAGFSYQIDESNYSAKNNGTH